MKNTISSAIKQLEQVCENRMPGNANYKLGVLVGTLMSLQYQDAVSDAVVLALEKSAKDLKSLHAQQG
jgi:endonuclease III